RLGARIRASKTEHLMARANELSNDRRSNKARCSCHKHFHSSSFLTRKRFSNHFFTFLPERLSSFKIERVAADAFTYAANRHVARHGSRDGAVLAIVPADLIGRSNDTGPHGCSRALRD